MTGREGGMIREESSFTIALFCYKNGDHLPLELEATREREKGEGGVRSFSEELEVSARGGKRGVSNWPSLLLFGGEVNIREGRGGKNLAEL